MRTARNQGTVLQKDPSVGALHSPGDLAADFLAVAFPPAMATGGKPAAPQPPPAAPSSSERALESVHFSSGNPRIEETRGVVVLHPDPPASSWSHLPVLIGISVDRV